MRDHVNARERLNNFDLLGKKQNFFKQLLKPFSNKTKGESNDR